MDFQYDYYTVVIPHDEESEPFRRAQLALHRATEQARTWANNAVWTVVYDSGHEVRVSRKSQKCRR